MKIQEEEIQVISRLVDDLCGVVLDQTKAYLIENRLSSVAEEAGCKSFSELYYKARYDDNKQLQCQIIDAITTNETLFFRDTSPFEALQHKALPELIDAKSGSAHPQRIRVWSAACSTGQEPYSMAMTFHELIGDLDGWDIQILATDISDAAIKEASTGRYGQLEIQRGMKPALLSKYFTQEDGTYKAKDELRSMISFKRLNLLEQFSGLGMFDVILCRNVAIYFDRDVRAKLFERLCSCLNTDGYLFVGSSESLNDLGPRFAPQHHCRAVFYRPNLTDAPALRR